LLGAILISSDYSQISSILLINQRLFASGEAKAKLLVAVADSDQTQQNLNFNEKVFFLNLKGFILIA
jgi:hypothetical protein